MGDLRYRMSYHVLVYKDLKRNMIEQSRYWYFVLFLGTKISRIKFLETFGVSVIQATVLLHGCFHQN